LSNDALFCTWPNCARPAQIAEAGKDLEDGELEDLSDGENKQQTHSNERKTAQPVRTASRPSTLEDGEIESESDKGDTVNPPCRASTAPSGSTSDAGLKHSNSQRATGSRASVNPPERSVGSRGHETGACKPCAWFHKSAARCRNGAACEYCHLCGPGEIRRRKQLKILKLAAKQQAREAFGSAMETNPSVCVEPTGSVSVTSAREAARSFAGSSPFSTSRSRVVMQSPPAAAGSNTLGMEPCYVEVSHAQPATS